MLYFSWSKWIFNITFWIFFAECSATWQLDCRLPCDRSAGQSLRWQVLELIFGGLLTTHVCVSETSGCVHACVSETSGSDHAWVSETHVSCTFPCTKRPKKTFSECCRFWKVLPISIRNPFPCHTDTQNAACAKGWIKFSETVALHGACSECVETLQKWQ